MTVNINVKTTIFQDGQEEIIEGTAQGDFIQKAKSSYLQYDEISDQGSIHTILKIAEDEALILRSGAVKMKLPFKLNQRMSGNYEVPFGKFETTTVAKNIDLCYDNNKGKIDLRYDFSMQGAPSVGTYHLEITFQEEE
ncbi:DUF1934 domain-containing protein [Neobacillus sp. PS3-12]|uniref:DUF1934 domain-containing protein n=1 Tax=Neobacillus sp. PS3-12 TaxID=3070677 RepID=UPI0027E0778E|nr:DUF1934 domain-containing protein [Neobacillus sp. PS3-12]WML55317.1 DUF1934 domain-containing protein [Neobacillus sp. PS3-12]